MIPINESLNASIPSVQHFSEWVLSQPYLILVIFVISLLFLYKLIKIAIKGTIIMVAGFLFPYVINFFGLPIPIQANTQTAINFAIMAFCLFIFYEFASLFIFLLKMITWPIRVLIRKRKYRTNIRKEVERIERKRT